MLLNGTKFTPTMLGWADNNGNFINSYEQLISSSNYVDLKGGQAYTFKVDNYANIKAMQLVYLSGTTIQTFVNANVDTNAHTFTPQTNTRVWARYNINAINTETYINAQLEQGSTATSYEEHKEQTLPLNLGTIELNKIGNYQDYIYKNNDKWYKKEYIGKVVLNGTESWYVDNAGTANWFYRLTRSTDTKVEAQAQTMCNEYPVTPIGNNNTNQGIWLITGYVRVRWGTEDTTTNWKTWLSTHNIICNYIKDTAQDIEITDTSLIEQLEEIDKMQGYNGTTIITSTYDSNNAQMYITASGLKELE